MAGFADEADAAVAEILRGLSRERIDAPRRKAAQRAKQAADMGAQHGRKIALRQRRQLLCFLRCLHPHEAGRLAWHGHDGERTRPPVQLGRDAAVIARVREGGDNGRLRIGPGAHGDPRSLAARRVAAVGCGDQRRGDMNVVGGDEFDVRFCHGHRFRRRGDARHPAVRGLFQRRRKACGRHVVAEGLKADLACAEGDFRRAEKRVGGITQADGLDRLAPGCDLAPRADAFEKVDGALKQGGRPAVIGIGQGTHERG